MTLNFDVTCRICLESCAEKNIFNQTSDVSKIPSCYQMITDSLCLLVEKDDKLPNKICSKCYSRLLFTHRFKSLAKQSNDFLINSLNKFSFDGVNALNEKSIPIGEIESNNGLLVDNRYEPAVEQSLFKFEDIKKEFELEAIRGIKTEADFGTEFILNGSLNFDSTVDDESLGAYSDDVLLSTIRNGIKKKKKNDRNKCKKRGPKKKCKIGNGAEERLKICDLCGKRVVNIKQHISKHSDKRKRYPCVNCDRVFMTYGARKNHNLIHHMGLLYYCELCKKHYKRGSEHRRIVHSNQAKQHKCTVCEKSFLTRSNLDIHMTMHSKVKPFQCTECGKAFRLKYCMLHHKRRVHDGEKSHICQYCSKGFFSSHHLRVHLRSHTKEKIYKCMQCPKMFSTASAKKIHEKRHTGEKNFKCQYCDMAFYDNGALRIHTVSHTKERKYECKYCNVKFGRSDHRNRHQRTAHEKNILFAFLPKD